MIKLSSKELLFIKNLLLTAVLGGLIGFLNYLFNIYVARYTSEDIFSIFSAAVGFIYLLQIPNLAIQAIITKKVGEKKDFDLTQFKWRSLFVFTGLGIVFSSVFYLFKFGISDIASIPVDTVIPLALVFFFAFISPVAKGILLGRERIIFVNLVLLSETLVKFAMGFIAIKMGGNIPLLILANGIPAAASTLILLPFIKEKGREEVKPIHNNYKELGLMAVSFFLLSTPYTLDLILVNPAFRSDYSALTLIGKVVYFGCITIATVMFARLVNQENKAKEIKTLFFSLFLTLLIGLGISAGIFLFKDFLVEFVFGGKYGGIVDYMAIYGVCMTGYAFVYMVINYLMAEGRYIFIAFLIFTTLLEVFLFSRFNADIDMVVRNQGILYGTLFVLTCISLILHIRMKRNEKK